MPEAKAPATVELKLWSHGSGDTDTVTMQVLQSGDFSVVGPDYVCVGDTGSYDAWECSEATGNQARKVTGVTWEVTQGKDRVDPDGPVTADTFDVTGVSPSEVPGDVTIQAKKDARTAEKQITVCQLEILGPADRAQYEITAASNYTSTSAITFQGRIRPGVGRIDWTLSLDYVTMNSVYLRGSTRNFQTDSNENHTETYTSEGGKVTVRVFATSFPECKEEMTLFVTGGAIPSAPALDFVRPLHTAPTAGLLTGICDRESSPTQPGYGQFGPPSSRFGIWARWPYESTEKAVGLMQVKPATMALSWNWQTNCTAGASKFSGILGNSRQHVINQQAEYPNLPDLTEIDHEDQALSKYGGYKVWLFGPNEAKDGWVEMTTGGRAYANDVRNRIQ